MADVVLILVLLIVWIFCIAIAWLKPKSFFILLLLLPGIALGQEIYLSEEPVTFGWDASPWSDEYSKICDGSVVSGRYLEYELQLSKEGAIFVYFTRETRFTVRPPQPGSYVLSARTRLMNVDGTQTGWCPDGVNKVVSDWCRSDTLCAMLKTGVNGPWKVAFQIIPPAVPVGLRIVSGN